MHKNKSNRRHFLKKITLGVTALPLALSAAPAYGFGFKKDKNFMVYIGTYAKPEANSIFLYRLNPESGELTRVKAFKAGANPSYLTLTPDKRFLYAVNEIGEFYGRKTGAVSAFAVDAKTGDLTLLNQQATGGGAPCYVSLDKTNKLLLVANYSGGNVIAFPVQPNGSLGNFTALQQHLGKGPNAKRQDGPHAHCVISSPDNQFVFTVDLGIDKIKNYRLDTKQGNFIPNPGADFSTRPGAGPRHLTFHENGKYAYLINELNSTITALSYNSSTGIFTEMQTISTLPVNYTGESFCADIHVSPNGKFLYGSNRGHDSLVVFSINHSTGKLSFVEHVPTQGKWPRNFGFDPSGGFVLVANQNTNNIVTFRADSKTGKLTPTGHSVEVPSPVCVQVVPAFS